MDMVNMKQTTKGAGTLVTESPKDSVPSYPYGLNISLNNDSLKKLGLSGELPEVGQEVMIHALAKVERVSSSDMNGGEKQRNVDLQITDLCLCGPEKEESMEEKLYGEEEEEG